MARVSPIQESFASGEISKNIRGRVSTDVYKQGLGRARNWMPTVQGPIRLRDGSKYMGQVDAANWAAGDTSSSGVRAFTFRRGLNEDVIVEVGETDIVLRDSNTGAQIVGGVTGNLIPNSDYADGSNNWVFDHDEFLFGTDPAGSYAQIGPFFAGTPDAYFQITGPVQDVPQGMLTGTWRSGPAGIDIPAGSELLLNVLDIRWQAQMSLANWILLGGLIPSVAPLTDMKFRVRVGTSSGAGDVLDSNFNIDDPNTWANTIINFTPGAGNNKLFLEIGLMWVGPGAIPAGLVPEGFGVVTGVHSLTTPLTGGSGTPVEFASPWDVAQIECLSVAMDPGEQVMMFTEGDAEPRRLRFLNGEWTFETLSAITSPSSFVAPTPNPWAAGNYPRACAYHEGRLWLGGASVESSTLWASASGDYQNFDNVTPADKSDPLLFPLSSAGKIQTITSRKVLVVLTDISEVIGTSVQGVISFDDFSFPKQTDWGSNCVQPVLVGKDMVYTSATRKIIRTFADGGDSVNGWDGIELSLVAEDIFGSSVREMVFLDEPAYQVAFLLSDGTMAMATYYYPEKVIGWWRFSTAYNDSPSQNSNRVMSITPVDTSTGSKLVMMINRVGFSGTTLPNYESITFKQNSRVALDSCLAKGISLADGTCSGLDHLTGQDVEVVVEVTDPTTGGLSYAIHPAVTVAAGVTGALQNWAWGQTAYIGHFFDNDFQLLPVEGVSARGTSQSSKRRWNEVYLRLGENSSVPLVDGEYPRDRAPATPMGQGEVLGAKDVRYTELGSGQGELLISQDRPLISEVLAIFGKLSSKEI